MIWNLGSINVDNFYYLPHLVAPGETLAATDYKQGLGGKGANMSVACARAGARVSHIGAVGPEGKWAVDRLLEYGVDTPHITLTETPTGHANICIDRAGENSIVLFSGANGVLTEQMIGGALTQASAKDVLLMQNETNGQPYAARTARTLGLQVVYAAAPFSAEAVLEVIDHIDLLVLNEVEAAQLRDATGKELSDLVIENIVVTLGSMGCELIARNSAAATRLPAYKVNAVDTTGAGDTFTGYLVAGLDRGMAMLDALDLALRAAALMVTRRGTADVVPELREVRNHNFD
ncbi:ribokinase [Sulfitobacter brevis]|uniref:Ribokinase n=1 Tax=Sulfitobacter brevis TaxID=74348 RepID=A0A1I1Y7Y8_9RHOB|nr:ribokinase [Sulfitobacter brevis]SFE15684.1 ribokinase [Sulfitobacter brevis]